MSLLFDNRIIWSDAVASFATGFGRDRSEQVSSPRFARFGAYVCMGNQHHGCTKLIFERSIDPFPSVKTSDRIPLVNRRPLFVRVSYAIVPAACTVVFSVDDYCDDVDIGSSGDGDNNDCGSEDGTRMYVCSLPANRNEVY